MLVDDGKRELLELDGQIDPFEIDVLGNGDGDRGEVENPFDSGGNQGIGGGDRAAGAGTAMMARRMPSWGTISTVRSR